VLAKADGSDKRLHSALFTASVGIAPSLTDASSWRVQDQREMDAMLQKYQDDQWQRFDARQQTMADARAALAADVAAARRRQVVDKAAARRAFQEEDIAMRQRMLEEEDAMADLEAEYKERLHRDALRQRLDVQAKVRCPCPYGGLLGFVECARSVADRSHAVLMMHEVPLLEAPPAGNLAECGSSLFTVALCLRIQSGGVKGYDAFDSIIQPLCRGFRSVNFSMLSAVLETCTASLCFPVQA
jgi:hypothetical protein